MKVYILSELSGWISSEAEQTQLFLRLCNTVVVVVVVVLLSQTATGFWGLTLI